MDLEPDRGAQVVQMWGFSLIWTQHWNGGDPTPGRTSQQRTGPNGNPQTGMMDGGGVENQTLPLPPGSGWGVCLWEGLGQPWGLGGKE